MKQRGFTLVELLVALAVGSLVIIATLGVLHQVVWSTSRTNSQVITLTDVHQAALRLKKDVAATQTTDLTEGIAQDSVILSWTDYTNFNPEESREHSSAYNLLSDGVLQRIYDGTTSIAGRGITSINFTRNGRVIDIVITAEAGDIAPRSETLEFSVYLRGEEIE
ncbi:type II secretion system protein J [Chloroflexota bacterium]